MAPKVKQLVEVYTPKSHAFEEALDVLAGVRTVVGSCP